jgi:hypothetical protein
MLFPDHAHEIFCNIIFGCDICQNKLNKYQVITLTIFFPHLRLQGNFYIYALWKVNMIVMFINIKLSPGTRLISNRREGISWL